MTDKNRAHSNKVRELFQMAFEIKRALFPGYTPLLSRGSGKFNIDNGWVTAPLLLCSGGHSPCSWGQISYFKACGMAEGQWHRFPPEWIPEVPHKVPALIFHTVTSSHKPPALRHGLIVLNQKMVFLVCYFLSESTLFPLPSPLSWAFLRGRPSHPQHQARKLLVDAQLQINK